MLLITSINFSNCCKMKIKIFIILIVALFPGNGHAQNNTVSIILTPQKKCIPLNKLPKPVHFDHSFFKTGHLREKDNTPQLFFNTLQLPKLKKGANLPFMFFTELSFSDILENSLNRLKADLINSYDDHITELFKDAPSLVKLRCIINL